MASSPRCPSCGYRALRHRKRTHDFVCRRCRASFPAGASPDELGSFEDVERRLAVSVALSEIDAAALAVNRQHTPRLRLIGALSLTTCGLMFFAALDLWSWYVAVGVSVVAAASVFAILSICRVRAWVREHPALVRLVRTRILPGRSVHYSEEALFACVDAVQVYLPESESAKLLKRLDEAGKALARGS